MKIKIVIVLTSLVLSGCIKSSITLIPCNEISPEVCELLGDRTFEIICSSRSLGIDANDVRNKCLKDIAKAVHNMGFQYFAVPVDKNQSYSQDYTYTTNQAITTYHDYNSSTNSNMSVYGGGYVSGYSAYGYGNSNTKLSGTSTSYIPVQQDYTVITHQRKMICVPLFPEELRKTKYFRVSDYYKGK